MDQGWTSLSEPSGVSPLGAAALWLQATLLGTIATSIAVIAVAGIGLLLLSGRIPYRRGMTVLAGCFIVFGAARIATGLQSITPREDQFKAPLAAPPPALPPPPPAPPVRQRDYDPYAGASVPQS